MSRRRPRPENPGLLRQQVRCQMHASHLNSRGTCRERRSAHSRALKGRDHVGGCGTCEVQMDGTVCVDVEVSVQSFLQQGRRRLVQGTGQ